MSAITLKLTPGGTNAGTQFNLHELGAQPPLRFFRKALYLRLNGDPAKLTFNKTLTVFKAQFQPQTYNVLNHAVQALKGTVTGDGDHYVVELKAPRSLSYVRVSPAPNDIAVHRMDGEALSAEPTLEFAYGVPSNIMVAQVNTGMVLAHAMTKSGAPPQTMLAISDSMGAISNHMEIGIGVEQVAYYMYNRAPLPAGRFVDQRFALRLLPAPANSPTISEVAVQSFPTGPRIGIAPADDLGKAVFFWMQAGEFQATVTVNIGDLLADALNAHLSGLTASGAIDIALVIESDAECGFALQQVTLQALNVVDTFTTSEPKHVLRFATGSEQTAPVTLPRAATIVNAQVNAVESLRGDRVGNGNGSGTTAARGAHVGAGRIAAQMITPDAALMVTGVGLLLTALVDKSALSVEVEEDWQGQPSGKILASATLNLTRTGYANLEVAFFSEPLILSTLPCWIVVSASNGQAVWIAQNGGSGLGVFERINGSLTSRGRLDGLGAVFQWLTKNSGDQPSGAGLSIGGQVVNGVDVDDKIKCFDLKAALNAYLSSLPANPPVINVPLVYTSTVSGLVTLNNLYIEYDT